MKRIILFICVLFVVLIVFRFLFLPVALYGGDYIHLSRENLLGFLAFPLQSWDSHVGLGWNRLALLGYAPYDSLIGIISVLLGFQTAFVERIVWWIPFLSLSGFSIYKLTNLISPKGKSFSLSLLIFLLNTYILLLISGGQIGGVGMAYAVLPYILYSYIRLTQKFFNSSNIFPRSLFCGLLLAIQGMFDLRILYLTLAAVFLYWIVALLSEKKYSPKTLLISFFFLFVLPGFVVFLFHLYWIIPLMIYRVSPIQSSQAYTSVGALQFFSFAKFENSISLLHPNWPENIFGKVYFMRPEFLVLPILAFGSLLFVNSKSKDQKSKPQIKVQKQENNIIIQQFSNSTILFFILLALIGAFLGKGTNDPFESIYHFLFVHVPGFSLFRDSTKWYMLVAVSYAVLIPYTIYQFAEFLKSKEKISIFKFRISIKLKNLNFKFLFSLLFILYFVVLIRQAAFGQLAGVFQSHAVPLEYQAFNQKINQDSQYYRTFWIPTPERYADLMLNHPMISGTDIANSASISGILSFIQSSSGKTFLQNAAVKYVVVPDDVDHEIFLKDRKYDDAIRQNIITSLQKIPWLHEEKMRNLELFKINSFNGHFFGSQSLSLQNQFYSPTQYAVTVPDNTQTIVFSEAYDPYWYLQSGSSKIFSKPYAGQFNSFSVPSAGTYQIDYEPQQLINMLVPVSVLSILLIFGFCIYKRKEL